MIAAALAEGDRGIGAVARCLGISEASLYRRLRADGASYSDLVRAVRRERALAHLDEAGTKLTEVALLLGYSELSAFSRAFRGWTGLPPTAYRRRGETPVTAASGPET